MILYLIKSSIIWLLWLIVFVLLLSKSKQYSYNRIYLLLGLIIGVVFPLIHIPNDVVLTGAFQNFNTNIVVSNNPNAIEIATNNGVVDSSKFHINWHLIIGIIYGIGVLYLLIKTIREILWLINAGIKGNAVTINNVKVVLVEKDITPFSFMGHIYINANHNYTESELDMIIRHELAHNNRRHYWDIIFIQILQIIFWFNPIIWWYKNQIRLQHEYECDAIASGENDYEYGQLLLKSVSNSFQFNLSHNFYYSPIKNRIAMITKTQKNSKWLYALILPMIAISTFAMAQENQFDKKYNGDIVTFMGKDFLFSKKEILGNDTIFILDPETFQEEMQIMQRVKDAEPIKVDGTPIKSYNSNDSYSKRAFIESSNHFSGYLINEFQNKLKLPSKYINHIEINNVVIDENGKLIYWDIAYGFSDNKTYDDLTGKQHQDFQNQINKIVNNAPLQKGVSEVAKETSTISHYGIIDIKDGEFEVSKQ